MTNKEKLRALLLDVFLLEAGEFSFELTRSDVPTWDSLGLVSLGVGVEETFGYHMTPAEITAIGSVPELVTLLATKGIAFDD